MMLLINLLDMADVRVISVYHRGMELRGWLMKSLESDGFKL